MLQTLEGNSSKAMTEDRLPLTSQSVLEDKIPALRELFPEVFAEGKVDFERLKQALGASIDEGRERYGLSWAGKSEAIRNLQAQSVGTLTPVPEESVNFETTENIFIEGDNLEVLKLLQKSYHNQIKMIYIDPPYNTGKEFIYPDNFREGLEDYLRYSGQKNGEGIKLTTNTETDGRFHSKWLNMMYPRLFLARNLLRDDGVIFVSIDDHEVYNLRSLMNEVFGEENFIAQLIWEKTRKNDSRFFSIGHEYMVVYGKNEGYLRQIDTYWREEKPGARQIQEEYLRLRSIHNDDDEAVAAGLKAYYASLPRNNLVKKYSRYCNVDSRGVWRDDNMSWPGGDGPTYEVIHPITGQPCAIPDGGWRYSTKEKMLEMIEAGVVVFRADHTEPPIRKTYLVRSLTPNENGDTEPADEDDISIQVMGSYFYKSAQPASRLLTEIFGKKTFDNPKDHEVIARMIRYVTKEDDIILDFFAGSGTTAHSVLEVNAQDESKRKFILVQLPEPTNKSDYQSISDICKDRLRKVISKLNQEESSKLNLYDLESQDPGFKVFKLTKSNFKIWDGAAPQNVEQLSVLLQEFAENIRPGTTKLGMLYEILLKAGFPLTANVEKLEIAGQEIYAIEDQELFICLEYEILEGTVRQILTYQPKPKQFISLDSSFRGNDQLKTNTQLQMRDHDIKFRTV